MPASGAKKPGRRASDIAEIDNQHQIELPGATAGPKRALVRTNSEITDTELIIKEPEPVENGEPRLCVEAMEKMCFAITGIVLFALSAVPVQAKKGKAWYTTIHLIMLFSNIVCAAALFFRNTHIKLLRFLSAKMVFGQVVGLSLVDWSRVMIMPHPEWAVTDQLQATIILVFRLTFIWYVFISLFPSFPLSLSSYSSSSIFTLNPFFTQIPPFPPPPLPLRGPARYKRLQYGLPVRTESLLQAVRILLIHVHERMANLPSLLFERRTNNLCH